MQNASGSLDLHGADRSGVSGRVGDRALDNRSLSGMGDTANGGRATVADRTWFRDLQAFTIAGWFKTDGAQSIGNGAVLMQQADANGGWSLTSTTSGRLSPAIASSASSTQTATSNVSYGTQNDWVFFAVTFDARPSSNEVQFYVGSSGNDVTSAGQASISATNTSDLVTSQLVIGDRFDGLLDNMRLFTARKDITWIDEDGTSYTRNGNNQDYAVLNLSELQTLRAFDLGINQWNVDADGAWSNNDNWVPNAPNDSDATANFTKAVTARRTVTVDSPVTIGQIRFGAGSYSIAGTSTITFQSATGAATIALGATPQSIIAPLNLLANTTISGTATLTTGGIANSAALVFQTNVDSGAIDGAGSISVAAGTRLTASRIRQAGLSVGANGSARIVANGAAS